LVQTFVSMNQSLLDYNYRRFAPVAQWTERRTSNPQVVRSSRTRGTYLFMKGLIGGRLKLLKIQFPYDTISCSSSQLKTFVLLLSYS
jgi:hypothetical protein